LVGKRLEDLKLGKTIKPLELTSVKLHKAMVDILTDDSYLERMIAFSKTSKQHDGNKNSCVIFADVLRQSEDKKDQ
jgi:UDP:flavonoid glycosyltransferase YjiC (YdhE family)